MAEIWLRKYKANGIQMVFKVKVFDNIDFKFTSPISPMPLPEESGEENILVKMEGNTHTCQLTWLVKNEATNQGVTNTNLSGATQGSTKTMFDQLKWFSRSDGFIGRSMVDKFDILIFDDFSKGGGGTLTTYPMTAGAVAAGNYVEFQDPLIPADADNPADGDWTGLRYKMEGFIRDFNFRTQSSEPATFRGTIQFIEGNAVGSYQGSKPDAPTNVRVTAPVEDENASPPVTEQTHLWVRWLPPAHKGNSSITHYDILYRNNNSIDDYLPYRVVHGYAGSGGFNLPVLSANTEYAIKVRAVNSDGVGRVSATRYLATAANP